MCYYTNWFTKDWSTNDYSLNLHLFNGNCQTLMLRKWGNTLLNLFIWPGGLEVLGTRFCVIYA